MGLWNSVHLEARLGVAAWPARWYRPAVASPEPQDDDPISDQALVERMARGDSEALGLLYDRHARLVLALVRRIVRVAAEAEDLVHDVFLEAWRRAAGFDAGRGSVRTWLALRARSRALDHVKSAAVQRNVALGESELAVLSSDLGAAALLAPDLTRVRRAVLSLPEEQRQVVMLGYFEGLSSTEIAERMKTPVGTVKSRVAAAMARLRAALAEEAS